MAKDCIAKLLKDFEGLTKGEAKRMVEAFEEINHKIDKNQTTANALNKKQVNNFQLERIRQNRAELHSLLKKEKHLEAFATKENEKVKMQYLSEKFVGASRPVEGGFNSIEGQSASYKGDWSGQFLMEIEAAGFKNQFISGAFDKNVIKEYFDRSLPGYKKSSMPEVVQTADIIEKLNKLMIQTMQENGSTIEYNPFRVIAASYDRDIIMANVEKFIDVTVDRIETFKSIGTQMSAVQKRRALKEFVENLDDINATGVSEFQGGAREIIWKDGGSFADHMEEFGVGTLFEGIAKSINRAADEAALVKEFGNRPFAMVKELKEVAKKTGGHSLFQETVLDQAMARMKNKGKYAENPDAIAAKLTSGIRSVKTLQIFSKLGKSVFNTFFDYANMMNSLRMYNGDHFFSAATKTLKATIENATTSKQSKVLLARQMHIVMDDVSREIFDVMGGAEQTPGTLAKGIDTFMHWTGNKPLTNFNRNTAVKLDVEMLTHNFSLKKSELDVHQTNLRKAMGLSDAEITTANKLLAESTEFDKITPGLFKGQSKSVQEIGNKVANFYNGALGEQVPFGGAFEDIMLGKTLPMDHPARPFFEVFNQFKGPVAKIGRTNLKALRFSNPEGILKADLSSTKMAGQIILTSTLMGVFIDMLRGIIVGEEVEEMGVKRIQKAFLSSGSAGILVDMMAADATYRNGYKTPVAKDIQSMYNLAHKSLAGDGDKALDESVKVFMRNIPGQNYILLEAVLNRIMESGSASNY